MPLAEDAAPAVSEAMPNHLFTFPCPCCNKMIEVDTRSGKARAVRAEESKQAGALDDLLASQKQDQRRLDDIFRTAKGSVARSADELDAKLQRAKEEAKKDKDEKPRTPFDLD